MKNSVLFLWRYRFIPLLLLIACGLGSQSAADDSVTEHAERFFENQVRPIFVQHCGGCHGAEKQFGGLRLDSWSSLAHDSDSAPVVVAGDPDESLLIQAVRGIAGLQMPPENPLPEQDVQTLVRWVRSGAFWPASQVVPSAAAEARGKHHWAFQPIRSTEPPTVKNAAWPRNEIDAFILAGLESAGLAPAPEADKAALIRRVYFVLTGLPPTSDQVADFVTSTDPDAYRRLVEDLLASPHYGEKWARHWLDVARYSDSKGYVYAREERFWTHASAYRDWVVRFFNEDRPINDFLLLQLAADQTAKSADDWAAMGFLTVGRRFLGVKHDIIDDRIDVVSRGMMGLSVGCARCHDHKYDPIPIDDYYSLYGVFASSIESERSIVLPDQLDPEYLTELRKREQTLADRLAAVRRETADRVRGRVADYLLAQLELEKYPGDTFGQLFQKTDIIPSIVRRWEETIRHAGQQGDPLWQLWHQLTAIADLPPDRFATQAAVICQAARDADPSQVHPLVAAAFQNPPQTPPDIAARYGDLLTSVVQRVADDPALLAPEVDLRPNSLLKQGADTLETSPKHEKLERSESVSPPFQQAPNADAAERALLEPLLRLLYGRDSPCEVPDEPIVEIELYLDIGSCQQLWKLQGEVDRWTIQAGETDRRARILVDRAVPVQPAVFKRGNPLRKGANVPRQFLAILAGNDRQPFATGSGRLELAQEIISPENPLTSRVFVNRVWANCFGKGLVDTTSDFGLRASPPSHPELLDWLATRLLDSGWSMKDLHRQIVLSATFGQSDAGTGNVELLANAQAADPTGTLLWRWTPQRLTIEQLRDSILTATATLERSVGGKSVDLWNAPFSHRRTLYGTVDRQFLPGLLRVFDFANPDLHIAQRADTTTPQQALFFLNHPWMLQQARLLADSTGAVENPTDRIATMFRSVLLRNPTRDELAAALAFVSEDPPETKVATKQTAAQWSYGYGAMHDDGSIATFNPLPYFSGQSWQGGATYPDAQLGWVQLTASGGHPGNTRQHAAIRRWTAPRELVVKIESTLVHEPPQGDGVRAFVVASGNHSGMLAEASVHHSHAELNAQTVHVGHGDTIDFVVDIGAGLGHDQFLWRITLTEVTAADQDPGNRPSAVWDSANDFAGVPAQTLDAWQQLAQVLIGTNEFLFVP